MKKYDFVIKPSIDKVRENFLVEKGLKKKLKSFAEEKDKIDWDIKLDEDYNHTFRCRVDKKNEVNVILQNTFSMDLKKYTGSILECMDLFYSNNYPIIVIETMNGGGYAIVPMMLHQLVQMRSTNRAYFSYGMSKNAKEFLKKRNFDYLNLETCEPITSFDNFTEIVDYYDYNGLNISHNRSNPIDYVPFSMRKAMDDYRERYKDSTAFLKKPTDIIIFTDAFSYSATSVFTKSFQNTGTGIIVGYYGNPTIKGTHLFDGSQAPSAVINMEGTETKAKLFNLGIYVGGVTYTESYDISKFHQKKNPIPEEYQIYPVDERVEIYSEYSDDIYDKFINEGLKIHEKYNINNKCNPNNTKLLLHDEKCETFTESDLKYAHGGHRCNKEGSWEEEKCFPYYCDIGYVYDREENKCIEECPLKNTKSVFLYKKYNDKITVEKDKSHIFVTANRDDFYYVFEASSDSIYSYPRICIVDYLEEIYINKNQDSKTNIDVRVRSVQSDTNYIHLDLISEYDFKILLDMRLVFLLKPSVDHIFYARGMLDIPNDKLNIKIAKLDDKMTFDNIENAEYTDFKNYAGEDFYLFEKDKSYIIDCDYKNSLDQLLVYLNPAKTEENIMIYEDYVNYLYLQKNKNYTLKIEDNLINRALKLSRKTINSVITINKDGENIILNSDNLYYILDNYTGELEIEVKNEDAFVEILYNLSNVEILKFQEKKYTINSRFNLITIPKKYKSDKIKFEITGDNSLYSIHAGYSINNYNYYRYTAEGDEIREDDYKFTIKDIYKTKVMKDEYYTILIEKIYGKLNVKINVEDDDDGFPIWLIILISVGGVLLLIGIILLICICKRKRQLSNKEIEEKLNDVRELEG